MAGLSPRDTASDDAADFVDPAEFLFTNTTYHDCFLTVTDPDTKNVEKIGAASSHLISQSSVFRKILLKEKTGFKHIEINDVSPTVTKLMLTYIYGGKIPTIDRSTWAQLALAARTYDLQYLENKCCKKLVPNNVNEVFPALICVAHLDNATLLPHVTKIIQEKTDHVIKQEDFLKLDSKCLDFIASQETLAIKEAELWNALVKWATTNAEKEAKTARDVLHSTLKFVRLATLNQEEVISCVLPAKILSDSEVVQLLSYVSSKATEKSINWHVLCCNTKVRSLFAVVNKELPKQNEVSKELPKQNEVNKQLPPQVKTSVKRGILTNTSYRLVNQGLDTFSYFTIKPSKPVELESIEIQSNALPKDSGTSSYSVSLNLNVDKNVNGVLTYFTSKKISAKVIHNDKVTLRLTDSNGNGIHLSNVASYTVELRFTVPHAVFLLGYYSCNQLQTVPSVYLEGHYVYFSGPCHMTSIGLRM